jgi:hypothetical protein
MMLHMTAWYSTYLKSVKLDIGVAMRKTSDDALNSLLGTILVVAHFVADLNNGAPILRSEVLVGGLGYAGVSRKNGNFETRASY